MESSLQSTNLYDKEAILRVITEISLQRGEFSNEGNTTQEEGRLGIQPMNRPGEWKRAERQKEKEEKERSRYKNGEFDSVLFILSTLEGKLKTLY